VRQWKWVCAKLERERRDYYWQESKQDWREPIRDRERHGSKSSERAQDPDKNERRRAAEAEEWSSRSNESERKERETLKKKVSKKRTAPTCDEEEKRKLLCVFGTLTKLEDIAHLSMQIDSANLKYNRLLAIAPYVRELCNMVGMTKVKQRVFEWICYYLHTPNPTDIAHIVIEGSPGVGKSQLAKILAQILLHLGFLKNDNFVCAKRSDLIGKYLGHSSKDTQDVIDLATGGVLFLDEAYALGHEDGRDSFAKECIDTLTHNLTELVDGKPKFLCIIAGYKEELEKCFFSQNKGLQSRFPERMRLVIDGYNAKELFEMFRTRAQSKNIHLEVNPEMGLKLFESNHSKMVGFGRDVASLLDECLKLSTLRLMKTAIDFDTHPVILTEDVQHAFDICFQKAEKGQDHLTMYL
jgi:AAA+ superfamily predicted ATPase